MGSACPERARARARAREGELVHLEIKIHLTLYTRAAK
jgi:hypothetical protein